MRWPLRSTTDCPRAGRSLPALDAVALAASARCRCACCRKDNAGASGSRVCASSSDRCGFSTSRLPRSMRMASTCCAHCSLRTSTAAAFASRHRTSRCRYRERANARSRSGRGASRMNGTDTPASQARNDAGAGRTAMPRSPRCCRPFGWALARDLSRRAALQSGTRRAVAVLRDRRVAVPACHITVARRAGHDGPRRAVGRRPARVAAVAAAPFR